ncbi:MAG: L-lactate permease [Chloroflexota bacterium]
MIELTLLNWLLALAPVLTVLVLMLGFGRSGGQAGIAAFAVALVAALVAFGGGPAVIGVALGKSIFLALDVLLIVWMALFFYNVTNEAGALDTLGRALPSLTSDRAAQSLLVSWVFVSLLQGVGGFGVPVAVVAPLLVGLGYTATQAVMMSSLGHGWAVTFGSLGTSFVALTAVTGLDGSVFASEAAMMLGAAAFVSGGLVAYVATGWRGLLRGLPFLLVVGAAMAFVQWFVATRGIWTLGATTGALAGAFVGVGMCFTPLYRTGAVEPPPAAEDDTEGESKPRPTLLFALMAYAVLLVIAFSINLVPLLERIFDAVQLRIAFPEVTTRLGVATPAENSRAISLFGHPGTLLFYAGAIAFWVYRSRGYYESGVWGAIWGKVTKSARKSTIAIFTLVGMAAVMTHTGMTALIAQGISETVSASVYPLFAPLIGTLGAFMTGSNTNSNVVFGALQQQTAGLLGLSVPLILAAQTAGASLGSVLAPAKVIVGCSTVGLSGQEGEVIRRMILLGLLPVLLLAIAVWLLAT